MCVDWNNRVWQTPTPSFPGIQFHGFEATVYRSDLDDLASTSTQVEVEVSR